MAGQTTFRKREKEKAQKERQQEKELKRKARKAERDAAGDRPEGEDPDIAGIVPGPQPLDPDL